MTLVVLLVAALASFVFLYIWRFSFSKQIRLALKHREISDEEMNCPRYLLLLFIGCVWSTYGLFLLFRYLQPDDFLEMLTIPVGAWIFFILAMMSKHYAAATVPLKVTAVHFFGDLIALVIMSCVLWL